MIVHYKLKSEWDVDARLEEVTQLRCWLDELTEWQPDMYKLTFHSSGSRIIVWFDDPNDATLFKLSW